MKRRKIAHYPKTFIYHRLVWLKPNNISSLAYDVFHRMQNEREKLVDDFQNDNKKYFDALSNPKKQEMAQYIIDGERKKLDKKLVPLDHVISKFKPMVKKYSSTNADASVALWEKHISDVEEELKLCEEFLLFLQFCLTQLEEGREIDDSNTMNYSLRIRTNREYDRVVKIDPNVVISMGKDILKKTLTKYRNIKRVLLEHLHGRPPFLSEFYDAEGVLLMRISVFWGDSIESDQYIQYQIHRSFYSQLMMDFFEKRGRYREMFSRLSLLLHSITVYKMTKLFPWKTSVSINAPYEGMRRLLVKHFGPYCKQLPAEIQIDLRDGFIARYWMNKSGENRYIVNTENMGDYYLSVFGDLPRAIEL